MFSLLKHLRKDYYTKELDETKGDMKKTGKILKNAMNQNIKANSIEKAVIRNTEITDNAEIVEAFNEHFAFVGEKLAAQIENISLILLMLLIRLTLNSNSNPLKSVRLLR